MLRVTRLFLICLFAIFSTHIFLSRGLALDGIHILYKMIMVNSFYYIEKARVITHFFQHLPAWLFIKFIPSNSLSTLTQVFSFGLIWMHIISFLGCYFILPTYKKHYIFFPLFAFFLGPLTALGASISASLSVFSYIWFTAFVVYYSDFSLKTHKILFFLTPIPLFLSHEMMSYMAWPLMYLSILKLHKETYLLNRLIIKFVILFLFVASILSAFFVFFPVQSELLNRSEFFKSLFYLEFFLKVKGSDIDFIYPATISSFFLLILPFGQFLENKYYKVFSITCLVFICLFGISALVLPFYELFGVFKLTDEEEARVWVVCIALPWTLLIWWLFEKNKLKLKKSFLLACIFTAISLTGWRIGSDYQFYRYQKQFLEKLLKCKGIVDWSEISKNNKAQNLFDSKLFNLFNWSWKYMSSSLIYPRQLNIKVIVKSKNRFTGCYLNPPYGMCENDILIKNNKFFNFEKILYYEKNSISGCD